MTDLPIYWKWEDVPDGIATKTTIRRDHKRKLAPDQQPVALKARYNHRGKHTGLFYNLYTIEDSLEKPPPTAKQQAAIEKARYMAEKLKVKCHRCRSHVYNRYGDVVKVTRKFWQEQDYDHYVCQYCIVHQKAVHWARKRLREADFVILDTETADLYGEIIEIGILSASGEELLNQRIQPQGEIAEGAYQIHGISLEDLKDEPTYPEVRPAIAKAIEGKLVLIYNAAYDTHCLHSDWERHDLEPIDYKYTCAMKKYSQWVGEYSHYHGDYRWQALYGDQTAIGDCKAVLERLHRMAQSHNFTNQHQY